MPWGCSAPVQEDTRNAHTILEDKHRLFYCDNFCFKIRTLLFIIKPIPLSQFPVGSMEFLIFMEGEG